MMKKVFSTMVVAAAMFASYSAYDAQNERELSDAVLANVEALADDENGSSCRWERLKDAQGCPYHACLENGSGNPCSPCGSTM